MCDVTTSWIPSPVTSPTASPRGGAQIVFPPDWCCLHKVVVLKGKLLLLDGLAGTGNRGGCSTVYEEYAGSDA